MILYRPVGLYELALIASANWRAYPPRLPEQPGFAGCVTRFGVPDPIAARSPAQTVALAITKS